MLGVAHSGRVLTTYVLGRSRVRCIAYQKYATLCAQLQDRKAVEVIVVDLSHETVRRLLVRFSERGRGGRGLRKRSSCSPGHCYSLLSSLLSFFLSFFDLV